MELSSNFLLVKVRVVKPRMLPKLSSSRPLLRLITKKFNNHVFKLIGKTITVDLVKIELVLLCHEQIVKVLFFSCFLEGEDAVHNDEKYNCK